MAHPFFRDEFSLPPEPSFEGIISSRRVNTAPSPPSSPETSAAASPAMRVKLSRPKKRNEKSKASMAGLVGGESDSSDLTDSGEDDHAPSVVTATDGGETVDGDPEEDAEMQDVIAGNCLAFIWLHSFQSCFFRHLVDRDKGRTIT